MRVSKRDFSKTFYVPNAPDNSPYLKAGGALAALALAVLLAWAFGSGSSSDADAEKAVVATPSPTVETSRPTPETAAPSPSPPPTLPTPPAPKPTKAPVDLGSLVAVESVTDGDTIRVIYKGASEPVRLIGINTPEVARYGQSGECFGQEASSFARKKMNGKKVYLVRDGMQDDRDRYGRLLRFVILEDQTNVNELMVRKGFATYEGQYPVAEPFRSGLANAQRLAQESSTGLWSAC